jgi:hypothetical protein
MKTIGTFFNNLWRDDTADDEIVEIDTSVEAAESNDGCGYVILRDKTTGKVFLGVNVSGYEYDDDHVDVSVLPGDDPTKPYSKTVEVKLRAKEFPERFEVIEDHLGCDKDKTYRFKLKFFVKCRANIDRGDSVFYKERLLPLFELEEYRPRKGAKLPPIL